MSQESNPKQILIIRKEYPVFDQAVKEKFGVPIGEITDHDQKLEAIQLGMGSLVAARVEDTVPQSANDKGRKVTEKVINSLMTSYKKDLITDHSKDGREVHVVIREKDPKTSKSYDEEVVATLWD